MGFTLFRKGCKDHCRVMSPESKAVRERGVDLVLLLGVWDSVDARNLFDEVVLVE